VKRQLQARQTTLMQRPGKGPEHARPGWAQIPVQHLGVVSAEVGATTGRQPPELSRSQPAGPDIES